MIFYVQGRGQFPFDMLRRDRCFPATEADAGKLGERWTWRTVELRTDLREFTPARWSSFGWTATATQPAQE